MHCMEAGKTKGCHFSSVSIRENGNYVPVVWCIFHLSVDIFRVQLTLYSVTAGNFISFVCV